MSSPLLVAAIDFGTTYSGWAFSLKSEFDKDPTKVSAKNWPGEQLVSSKAPTCILIDPDGKTFDSFGYEAENKYAELAAEKLHKPWFYFQRFKMMLFDKMMINRRLTLEDESRKPLPAKLVFSLAIRFLKNDLLDVCNKQLADALEEDDILWVLTVPAIWNDAAKQFMREAAEDAGIKRSKLLIALEPEAASVYCRYLPVQKGDEECSLASFKPGTKYIVLDAGGGTVDITVHQVIVDGYIRELHKASGGAWGGTMVDKAYEQFLVSVAGNETQWFSEADYALRKGCSLLSGSAVVQKFKEEYMDDYIELFRTFEVKKREITPEKSAKIFFRLPPSFTDTLLELTGDTITKKISLTKFRDRLSYLRGKLRADADIVLEFFQKSVDSIVRQISLILQDSVAQPCSAILMVGGFSESKVLYNAIKSEFGRRMKIIIPESPGLTVLKGAVIFGHRPSTISERICKYTYGVNKAHKTSKRCRHPSTETAEYDGRKHCRNIFDKHVTIGQSVKLEEEQEERITRPVSNNQTSIRNIIYASTSPNPYLVTEPGCIPIGQIQIPISVTPGIERKFGSRFIFGGTEIAVKIEDKATGEIHIQTIDFLE